MPYIDKPFLNDHERNYMQEKMSPGNYMKKAIITLGIYVEILPSNNFYKH